MTGRAEVLFDDWAPGLNESLQLRPVDPALGRLEVGRPASGRSQGLGDELPLTRIGAVNALERFAGQGAKKRVGASIGSVPRQPVL